MCVSSNITNVFGPHVTAWVRLHGLDKIFYPRIKSQIPVSGMQEIKNTQFCTNSRAFNVSMSIYTASNLGLLLQKEQNVKWGEGPSGKQAVGKTMEHGKLCWHIFNHK